MPRVLIVDDHQSMLDLMATCFKQAGAKVKTVLSPEEALTLTKAAADLGQPFDMIVVDIQMPEMTGFQLAEKLREAGFAGPIAAFTNTVSGLGKKKGLEVGITTYLDKATVKVDVVEALLHQYGLS